MSFTVDKFYQYFEELATSHHSIRHTTHKPKFWKLNLEEILTTAKASVKPGEVMMIMEDVETSLAGADTDHPGRIRRGAFILCMNVPNLNYKQVLEAYTECERIGDEIIRKLYQDCEDREHEFFEDGLLDFDSNAVNSMTVGPVLMNAFGQRYEFNLVDSFDLLQEDDVWL